MRLLDRRLLRAARPVRALLALDVLAGLGIALAVIAQAWLLARIVTAAFVGEPPRAGELALLIAAFAARGALLWGVEVAGRRAAASVLSDLRMAVAVRRLRAQPAALDGVHAGEVAAAGVHGVDALGSYFARTLPQLALALVVPALVLTAVAAVDVWSAVVMVATLPLVPVFMSLVGRYTAQRTAERWQRLRLLSVQFLDVVRGLPTLRAFNRAHAVGADLAAAGDRYRRATMGTLRVAFLSGAVLELAATLGVAVVAVAVGLRLVDGTLGLEAGLMVLVLAPELYLPLRRLGAEYHAAADGLAVAERVLELLDAPAEAPPGGRRVPPDPAGATVRFERVSFAYPTRPGPVLDRVSLELEPGETVALVGESGIGKSTIAGLLLLLYAPTSGRVTAGGVDLAGCRPEGWRRTVAWLPQHPTLMRGTVADNIRLGDPSAGAHRVREAARLAGADPFIAALPDGYGTRVGPGGRPLAAGERRRIALARAFLRDAPLTILDEPTADLDACAAALVLDAIGRHCARRTVLVLAHQPDVADRADRVVRLTARGITSAPVLVAA